MPAPTRVEGYPSMRRAMLAILADAAQAHPLGLTVVEWRVLVDARWPITPNRFGAQVQSLRKTGLLAVAGGRVGHQRYLPAGATPVPRAAEPEFALQVLQALRTAERRAKGPVTVAAVRAALPTEVVPPHQHAVRRALLTLSTPRRRGLAALQQPIFRRTDEGAGGHLVTTWSTAPIGDAVTTRPSRTEALRQIIVAATDAAGMPLTANWLIAWGQAHGVIASWPVTWQRGIRRALRDAARRPTTRITVLEGPELRSPRFVVRDRVAPAARAAAHLEDLLRRIDLAQEYTLWAGLVHRARTHRALERQVAHRQRLMAALIAEALGEVPIEQAMINIGRAMDTRSTLVNISRRPEWQGLVRQLEALRSVMLVCPLAPWPERPPVCGEAGLMTTDAAAGWARAAAVASDLTPVRALTLMGNAAGVMVDGELRYDAIRAVACLLPYTATPRMHQHVLALLQARGTVDRSPEERGPLERFLETGAWDGPPMGATAKMRLRAGAWFGSLER